MEIRQEGTHQYDDIMGLSCHVPQSWPHMSRLDRAAQFSPFAALSGYEDAVKDVMRLTEEQVDLDEDSREELDRKLMLLQEHLRERPKVTLVYFQPDERKSGGAYRSVAGAVRKIDPFERKLVLEDGTALAVDHIVQIESQMFEGEIE